MDAPCEIQGSIHVFSLVNNMCPGKWVHINYVKGALCIPIFNSICSSLLSINHAIYGIICISKAVFYPWRDYD